MMNIQLRSFRMCALVTVLLVGGIGTSAVWAQEQPAGNVDPKGGKGGKKVRKLETLRERMQVSNDAEWQALQGRLVKVTALSKQYRDLLDPKSTMEGLKIPKKSDPAAPAGAAPTYVYPAQVEASLIALGERAASARAELANPEAPAAEIRSRLEEFRKARAEADKLVFAELKKARDELRELVTPRQELALVASGLLD